MDTTHLSRPWNWVFCFHYTLLRLKDDRSIAEYIEANDASFKDGLLLCLDSFEGKTIGDPDLIVAVQTQVSKRLETTKVQQWVSWKPLVLPSKFLSGCAIVVSICLLVNFTQITSAVDALLSEPEILSQRISDSPLIGDIRIMLTPPDYTSEPARAIDFSAGDIQALSGTKVRMEALVIKPSKQAKILWGDEGALPNKQKRKRMMRLRFTSPRSLKEHSLLSSPFGSPLNGGFR